MTERKKVERKGAGSAETSYYAAGLLRILRGEDVELVARAVEATAADVSNWRDAFLEGGASNLKQRHGHRSPNHFRRDAMDRIPAAA